MTDDIEISVIIITHDRPQLLGEQLASVARQEWSGSWEVVVADNGSGDETRRVVDRFVDDLPHLERIDASGVRGASFARNRGAACARGRSLVFLDDDDEVAAGYVAAMGEALRTHAFVAADLDHAKLSTWGGDFRPTFGQAELMRVGDFFPMASSAAMGVRHDVFDAVGGFDEAILSSEDADLSWRVQLAGTPLVLVPEAVLHSRPRADLVGHFRQTYQWGSSEAMLFPRYRPVGMHRVRGEAPRDWGRLAKRLVLARRRADLAWCASVLGHRLGRLAGSVRARAFFP